MREAERELLQPQCRVRPSRSMGDPSGRNGRLIGGITDIITTLLAVELGKKRSCVYLELDEDDCWD